MNEARQITPEQGERLRKMLEASYGEPTLDSVEVGEDGSVAERETFGDVPVTTRRTPATPNEGSIDDE